MWLEPPRCWCATLTHQVRHGVDSFVRLTHYRKSSEPFENLFCLHTVRDSHGEMRLSISLAMPLDENVQQQEHLVRMANLMERLPTTTAQLAEENGSTHGTEHLTNHKAASILQRIQPLLSSPHVDPKKKGKNGMSTYTLTSPPTFSPPPP